MLITRDAVNDRGSGVDSTDRAMHVRMVANAAGATVQDVRLTANTADAQVQASTFTGTPAAVGTTASTTRYNRGLIIISGLAAETIAVNSRANGVAGGALNVHTTAGVVQAGSALGNGTFYFKVLATDDITVVKSAAANDVTVNIKLYSN